MNSQAFEARYRAFHELFPGAVLLWDTGAFFELYFDDAKSCGDLLGLPVVPLNSNVPAVPMVGFLKRHTREVIEKLLDNRRQVVCLNSENVVVFPGPFVILGGDVYDDSRVRVFSSTDTRRAVAVALEMSAKMMTGETANDAAPLMSAPVCEESPGTF